jgi:hypothetical protein
MQAVRCRISLGLPQPALYSQFVIGRKISQIQVTPFGQKDNWRESTENAAYLYQIFPTRGVTALICGAAFYFCL